MKTSLVGRLMPMMRCTKIITSPKLDLKKHDIVDFAIELPTAFDNLDFLDKRNPFKEEYQSQLKGLSDYMIDKMVEKGITVKELSTDHLELLVSVDISPEPHEI